MSEIVAKRNVVDGMIDFIASVPEVAAAMVPVGDGDSPAVDPDAPAVDPPFIEVRRIPDGRNPQGHWGQLHNVEFAKFQLVFVSDDRQAAEGLADACKAAFIEQGPPPARGYLHPFPVVDHDVIHREVVSDLGLVASGRSFGCLHHYRVLVQRRP